jgi:hypothetical protein
MRSCPTKTKASQNWGLLYADHVFLAATDQAGVYENEVNFRLRIAPDHSRIWLNKNDGAGLIGGDGATLTKPQFMRSTVVSIQSKNQLP